MANTRNGRKEFFQLSNDDKKTVKKIEILTKAVEKVYPSSGMLIWRSFLQGLFFSLGSIIGLVIILTIITILLTQFGFIQNIQSLFSSYKILK